MYSYGPPHMAGQKQDDQHEHTFSSYVRIRDVALKTCQRRWTIGKSGERGSGISVLVARHDNDDCLTYRYLTGTPTPSRVDLGVMAMKGYSALPRSPELKPHHRMQFSVISRTALFEVSYPSARDSVTDRLEITILENSLLERFCHLRKNLRIPRSPPTSSSGAKNCMHYNNEQYRSLVTSR